MENNEINILISNIKLDKELLNLDINFIAFKEFMKLIENKNFNPEVININIFNEIKEVLNNMIKIKIEINFLKNNINFNKNKC